MTGQFLSPATVILSPQFPYYLVARATRVPLLSRALVCILLGPAAHTSRVSRPYLCTLTHSWALLRHHYLTFIVCSFTPRTGPEFAGRWSCMGVTGSPLALRPHSGASTVIGTFPLCGC